MVQYKWAPTFYFRHDPFQTTYYARNTLNKSFYNSYRSNSECSISVYISRRGKARNIIQVRWFIVSLTHLKQQHDQHNRGLTPETNNKTRYLQYLTGSFLSLAINFASRISSSASCLSSSSHFPRLFSPTTNHSYSESYTYYILVYAAGISIVATIRFIPKYTAGTVTMYGCNNTRLSRLVAGIRQVRMQFDVHIIIQLRR